jgi:hypothetical protein
MAPNLYVCGLPMMPFNSAANPVRTPVTLALRMSKRFEGLAVTSLHSRDA